MITQQSSASGLPNLVRALKETLVGSTERGIDESIGREADAQAMTFATETGCTLIADPTRIDLYGTAALLMHGDSLCTDDKDYQRLRAQVRDPDWQQQARELPVKQRMEMAEQARELSALSKQGKDEYIMDVNQDEVRRVMTEQDVTLLIHGHTHRPGEHSFSNGTQQCTRIVLGDWYNKGSVLTVNQQHRQLQTLEL